jgi:hypothetical protein
MFFALFYYLNKFSIKFKLKYLFALMPFLLMMLIQVTRMYILAFVVITFYHIMAKLKIQYRIFSIIFILLCYSFFFNNENKIIKSISDETIEDTKEKKDYIRFQTADYYLFKFSKNNISYLSGNGAYYPSSVYGKKILSLENNERYYLDDLGLIKGYFLFGLLFVLGYILIFIKSFTINVPKNKLYLKYYIWMIFILSFTTRANTNAGFGIVMVTVLYLFEFAHMEQESSLKIY